MEHFGRCEYCGGEFTVDDPAEGDHVVPRERGGCDCPENMIPAHKHCNREKGTKTPLEWYLSQEKEERFDYGYWTLDERKEFLLRAARWEAVARWHLQMAHSQEARW